MNLRQQWGPCKCNCDREEIIDLDTGEAIGWACPSCGDKKKAPEIVLEKIEHKPITCGQCGHTKDTGIKNPPLCFSCKFGKTYPQLAFANGNRL